MSTQPVFSRNSFNQQSPKRDIYSYEYLSRPFQLEDTTLPQINSLSETNPNSTTVGNALNKPKRTPEESARNKSTLQGIYGGLYAAGSMLPKQDYTSDFANQSKTLQQRQKVEKGFDTGEKAVAAIPGVGTAVAAFSSIGRGIGAQTVDKNGVYKSKASSAVDSNFNPVSGVSGALGIAKDVFDGGGINYDNIGNYATMGIFGKSASQTALKKEKSAFDIRNMYSKISDNQSKGALSSVNNANYKAVSYGAKGMKIRTKLSKY